MDVIGDSTLYSSLDHLGENIPEGAAPDEHTQQRFLQTTKGNVIAGVSLLAVVLAVVVGATCGSGACSLPSPSPSPVVLLQTYFSTSEDGFEYQDGLFARSNEPTYADREYVSYEVLSGNGALEVALGGRDDRSGVGMSGGWERDFELSLAGNVTINIAFQLELASGYEPYEYSKALCSIDGILVGADENSDFVVQLPADGDGGLLNSLDMKQPIFRLDSSTRALTRLLWVCAAARRLGLLK